MLKFLIEKEFKQLKRNSFMPKIIVAMPLVMMLILPWAANQSVNGIKLSVVDNDHSTFSQQLIQKITASDYFTLTDVSPTNNEAMKSIEAGKTDIIFEIENGFEKNLIRENVGRVLISANSVNGMKGGMGAGYLTQILNDYARELMENGKLRMENVAYAHSNEAQFNSQFSISNSQFTIAPQFKFNPHLDYKVFMVPAIMVMLLTIISGFLPALSIVGEKEIGTIEQINVTPVKRMVFVLSKLIPYWVIGIFILTVCMGLGALIYGLFPVGSLFTIYLFAIIYILVVSGFGLVISNYSNTMQQAMFVIFFFVMVFILMSGLFTPVASMPKWAQDITIFNPLKYLMQVMRSVYLKGSAFSEMMPQFFALCAFAIGANVWAVVSYKKSS
ncbi:MAG: ABC transporter permease [Bacteroidales bacterium]|jgi:ABC-2 type transport system permease protein|nr:ABC transporter permease [Bacteroidales bacterium]